MRIPRIHTPLELSIGRSIAIDGSAAKHLVKALRMDIGRKVLLFNGDGSEYPATILEIDKKQVILQINEGINKNNESPLRIHLGQSISRGDRMDYSIQKAVELGVSHITPLFSERCEVKLKGERLDKKMAHWQGVIISACEQCGRNTLPELHNPKSVVEWCQATDESLKLVLHHRAAKDLNSYKQPESVSLLIGPEGGLTELEINIAEQKGFSSVLFGPRVLRTETAALCAISVLQSKWGDF